MEIEFRQEIKNKDTVTYLITNIIQVYVVIFIFYSVKPSNPRLFNFRNLIHNAILSI